MRPHAMPHVLSRRQALTMTRGRAEAFVIAADPLLFSHMNAILVLAARHR